MLVAFLLAFIWGSMGLFRDKHRLLALGVTMASGTINAYFLCKILM